MSGKPTTEEEIADKLSSLHDDNLNSLGITDWRTLHTKVTEFKGLKKILTDEREGNSESLASLKEELKDHFSVISAFEDLHDIFFTKDGDKQRDEIKLSIDNIEKYRKAMELLGETEQDSKTKLFKCRHESPFRDDQLEGAVNLEIIIKTLQEDRVMTSEIKESISKNLSQIVENIRLTKGAETVDDALKLERFRGVVDKYAPRIVREAVKVKPSIKDRAKQLFQSKGMRDTAERIIHDSGIDIHALVKHTTETPHTAITKPEKNPDKHNTR